MQKFNSKGKSDLKRRCYYFSLELIQFIISLPSNNVSWKISDQLIKSGTSIGANLVEGSAASSRREFKKYHEIALKNANETKYWLCLLRDSQISEKEKTNQLLQETIEISNMLAAGIIKLKKR